MWSSVIKQKGERRLHRDILFISLKFLKVLTNPVVPSADVTLLRESVGKMSREGENLRWKRLAVFTRHLSENLFLFWKVLWAMGKEKCLLTDGNVFRVTVEGSSRAKAGKFLVTCVAQPCLWDRPHQPVPWHFVLSQQSQRTVTETPGAGDECMSHLGVPHWGKAFFRICFFICSIQDTQAVTRLD